MFKKISIAFLALPLIFTSCSKDDSVNPDSFVGTYEFQKVELNVDGNKIELPADLSTKDLVFNEDGSFSTPDDLDFFAGAYTYDGAAKTITFKDTYDGVEYTDVLNVESSNGVFTLKTKSSTFDDNFDFENATIAEELIFFSLFALDEESAAVKAFSEKIGENPKDFSLEFTIKKK
ncbi:hypothetical protein EGI22_17035 [Lacihabitans sp. LS3-19]|uniref:hypothetical protein n=1 Tax=Lacihabitans sp. LS3-19 TaxID=2487335 RepID=UPI0020CF1CCA|nr:hypothetical protein [Lacihabitans sp. LS3-19]MCP9769610.1 hypothetical protein [Lacihabitans sp. LS3-19]